MILNNKEEDEGLEDSLKNIFVPASSKMRDSNRFFHILELNSMISNRLLTISEVEPGEME